MSTSKPIHRHQARRRAARLRHRRARPPGCEQHLRRLRRPARRSSMFKGGQSNPTYKLIDAGAQLRDARQARPGGQAAAVGARGRARVRGHARRWPAPTCRCRACYCLCEDESRDRPRLLRHGVHAGPRAVGPVAARHDDRRQRGAIYDEMNRVIAALHTVDFAGRGPGRLRQARQLLRAPDRPLEQAVPGLRSPQPIAAMDRLIEWLPAHIPASARDETQGLASCTATTGSTT